MILGNKNGIKFEMDIPDSYCEMTEEVQIRELAETSLLPGEPDWARIQNFICDINKQIVNEEI